MVATAMYTGKAAMYVGAQLAIGGTGTLLAGTPQDKDEVDNYAFSGPVNNTRQGLPVPICYGQLLVGSSVISSGITAGAY
jgi:predicted phage tail protein